MPWDVRDHVDGGDTDGPSIQAIYDDVNRLVLLIGNEPFSTLFGAPIASLVPSVVQALRNAANTGLFPDPVRIESAIAALGSAAGTLSIGDLFVQPRSSVLPAALQAVLELRRTGIRVPIPGSQSGMPRRRAAMRSLLTHAGFVTYRDLFTVAKQDLPRPAVRAIQGVKVVALFSWSGNDRCCIHGKVGADDECVAHEGLQCYRTKSRISYGMPPPSATTARAERSVTLNGTARSCSFSEPPTGRAPACAGGKARPPSSHLSAEVFLGTWIEWNRIGDTLTSG